jgi:hypothetical protein
MNYHHQQHYIRNYNSLDRCSRTERDYDAEFDDCGFDRHRFGSGKYVRNELDVISVKHGNPDLVQCGKKAGNTLTRISRYDIDGCQTNATSVAPSTAYNGRVTSELYSYSNCETPGACKGSWFMKDDHLRQKYLLIGGRSIRFEKRSL